MYEVAVPILMYHEVSPHPHSAFRRYTVTVREFTRQMQWLATFGYRTIDMDSLVRARMGHGSLPDRPVLITFDDGFQGCVDHAAPVLGAYGFTATFYLVAGLIGEASRWILPELGLELPLMNWDSARRLASSGFQCGAHTLTHPRLARLPRDRCRIELVDARRRLEDGIGGPIHHLAYPFGDYDETVRALAAEAGYVSACSTREGLSGAADDQLALHRVPVYGHDSLLDFACRLRTGLTFRDSLRSRLDRVAARFHTSPKVG